MLIPAWASELIARQAEAFLQRPGTVQDAALVEAVRRLRAWPVYGDMGGTLLVAADGSVHFQDHDSMEVHPEPDPRWQTLAWVAAAEQVPELRSLLPARPADIPPCPACAGSGKVQLTPQLRVSCAPCWGLGWRRIDEEPGAAPRAEPSPPSPSRPAPTGGDS